MVPQQPSIVMHFGQSLPDKVSIENTEDEDKGFLVDSPDPWLERAATSKRQRLAGAAVCSAEVVGDEDQEALSEGIKETER